MRAIWRFPMRLSVVAGASLLALSVASDRGDAQRGATATPRSRPVSSAAGRAVNVALKTALANSGVRNAVRVEVARQLSARRPIALVNGYWVSVVDLAHAYEAAAVRPALQAALGTNAPQLIAQARVSADRLMLVFTPGTLAGIMIPGFSRDITATIGVDALKNHMTDVGPLVMIVVLGVSGTIGVISVANTIAVIWEWLSMQYNDYTQATGPNVDFDGDGIPNKDDKDDDNDNVPDEDDNYPHDPTRSICDCGRPALAFMSGTAGDILPTIVSTLTAAQAQRSRAVSLGTIGPGSGNPMAIVF